MSTIFNAVVSHFPSGSLRFPFHHVFSDAGRRKHHCPGLNWVANAATSLALCKQVSVFPFIVHSKLLNIDMKMIVSSKHSGFFRNQFFDKSVFVLTKLLDGSGFEIPTHSVESEIT